MNKRFKALTAPYDSLAPCSADCETVEEAVRWLQDSRRAGRVMENRNGEYYAIRAVSANGEVSTFEDGSVLLDDRPSPRRPKGAAAS